MSKARRSRIKKRQLGQFITPREIALQIVSYINPKATDKILEPSFGDGSFLEALIEYLHKQKSIAKKDLGKQIYGVELDKELFNSCLQNLTELFGKVVANNIHLALDDFFRWTNREQLSMGELENLHLPVIPAFDLIIGNPPFGGTFDAKIEDLLDKAYGFRLGNKIKKETYAFFIIKSVDLLKPRGKLMFICSDTFLTINTMKGLRNFLMTTGSVKLHSLKYFSKETNHPMVTLEYQKGVLCDYIEVDDRKLNISTIRKTPNLSWNMNNKYLRYFHEKLLKDYIVATSGMTIGKNEYFLKKITGNTFIEEYDYKYFNEKITLEKELQKARLGKLSPMLRERIKELERQGSTIENIKIIKRKNPKILHITDQKYRLYNKGQSELIFSQPKYVIYWENNGKPVYTYKKNGAWYLHGVGGKPYFGREGITWQLVAGRIYARYLPPNYILDSGAPCAFLLNGVDKSELYFILGWLATNKATDILKKVLNHTRNIQSKDIERLPYPKWVSPINKLRAINLVKELIKIKVINKTLSKDSMLELEELYELPV